MKYFILILALIGLYGGIAEAQSPTGFYVRTDCSGLSTPVSNGAVCLQTSTTGGRTAGRLYIWTGAAWTLINSASVSVDSTTLTGTGTDVQAVFEELDNTIDNHIADATDAHDASAISSVAAGNLVATDVQAALNELDTEKQPLDTDLTTIAGLADPNADRILFWDDSAGAYAYLAPDGTTISITTTTISVVNAPTATALASNPTDCAAGAYATTIAANGDLTCAILVVSSASDPTANDDTGDGYIVGTKWINTTTDTVFVAADVTLTAAVWVKTVTDHGALTGLGDDDHSDINVKYEATAGAPAAGSCDRSGQIQFDTTNSRAYGCYGAAADPVDFGDQSDTIVTISNGTDTADCEGGCTIIFSATGPISVGTPVAASMPDGTITVPLTTSMNTARMLGRTTASAGVVEEITVGTGLTLTATNLDITDHVKSIWIPASAMVGDGTNCPATPTAATINSGPKIYTYICADSSSSRLYSPPIHMPDSWNAGTLTATLSYIQTAADTGSMLSDIDMQCRGNGEVPSSTWGTAIAIDDAAVVGSNANDWTTSAAVTPAGTCAAGDMLYFRWTFDTASTTASATLHFLGIKLEYTVAGAGSD